MIWEEICDMRQDVFSSYHPWINFIYFVMIIGCAMFVMHPVLLFLSFLGGFCYYLYLKRWKAVKTALWMMAPIFLISILVNPLFNHKGVTILYYFKTGNPLTLESIVYGAATGIMLISVLNWFSCYQNVMTSDKFIYLFGKVIPAMSLILSMVFRFVPKFKIQIEKVSNAQKCIGRDVRNGNMIEKSRHGIKILSVMITWSLENSVDTADSMRSRGYGLRGRTNFSIYRFDTRDRLLCIVMGVLGAIVFTGILTKKITSLYYPVMMINPSTIYTNVVYVSYGILCFLPWIMNIVEDIKWHYLKSKI